MNLYFNPNGESDCDAGHMAAEGQRRDWNLNARLLTASPMEVRPL